MSQTSRKPRPSTKAEEPARPGRKPKGDRAMTGAERQRLYRERVEKATIEAVADYSNASRVTLIALLNDSLAGLDDASKAARSQQMRRKIAAGVIDELRRRYGLAD